jgi:hypothetical protein
MKENCIFADLQYVNNTSNYNNIFTQSTYSHPCHRSLYYYSYYLIHKDEVNKMWREKMKMALYWCEEKTVVVRGLVYLFLPLLSPYLDYSLVMCWKKVCSVISYYCRCCYSFSNLFGWVH